MGRQGLVDAQRGNWSCGDDPSFLARAEAIPRGAGAGLGVLAQLHAGLRRLGHWKRRPCGDNDGPFRAGDQKSSKCHDHRNPGLRSGGAGNRVPERPVYGAEYPSLHNQRNRYGQSCFSHRGNAFTSGQLCWVNNGCGFEERDVERDGHWGPTASNHHGRVRSNDRERDD